MADVLLELGIMFAVIAGVGALANRLGQSVIPFYIVVGMILSEFVLGRVALPVIGTAFIPESEFITIGAELGIVFLLFFLGLEFNLDRLLDRKRRSGSRARSTSRTSAPDSSSDGSSSARSSRRF